MFEERYYQTEAVDAVFDYWAQGGGNPLVDLATGTGKSYVIASIIRRLLADYPEMRILSLVHVKELVRGNSDEFRRLCPEIPIGINSAGLNRRDTQQQVLFAGIQSVGSNAKRLGARDLIIVDEAHLIPTSGNGRYRKLMEDLRELTPSMRVLGLTATPFRLDSGRLDEGDDALFDKTVYTYDIGKGIEDGFLSPLISKATSQRLDVSGVGKRGGEFIAGALEDAVNVEAVTSAACDEIVTKGEDRRAWLVFCCGVNHAESVRDALRERGVVAEMVTGQTPNDRRDAIIRAYANGEIKALVNVNVLTTGFNVPHVDMLAMLRPTMSTSLYVQMVGRGTRNAANKDNCLILDFAENVRRHGPVNDVNASTGRKGGKGEGAIPAKECPNCASLVATRVYECPDCGHQWEKPEGPKHNARSDQDVEIVARQKRSEKWHRVSSISARVHRKDGSPDMVCATYYCGFNPYNQYILPQHPGYAGDKSRAWLQAALGTRTVALSEIIQLMNNNNSLAEIRVEQTGRFMEIVAWRVTRPDGTVIEIDKNLRIRIAPRAEAAE